MQKQRFLVQLAVLVALFAALAAACGGADNDPIAATSTVVPQATLSPAEELQQATSRPIRRIETAIQRVDTRLTTLEGNIGRDSGEDLLEERGNDWFDECCDDEDDDIVAAFLSWI